MAAVVQPWLQNFIMLQRQLGQVPWFKQWILMLVKHKGAILFLPLCLIMVTLTFSAKINKMAGMIKIYFTMWKQLEIASNYKSCIQHIATLLITFENGVISSQGPLRYHKQWYMVGFYPSSVCCFWVKTKAFVFLTIGIDSLVNFTFQCRRFVVSVYSISGPSFVELLSNNEQATTHR